MILIISDTHNSIESIQKLKDLYTGEQFDAIIHAGDVTDFNVLKPLEGLYRHFYLVKGNGDSLNLDTAPILKNLGISFSQAPFEFKIEGYGNFVIMHQPYFIEEYKNLGYIKYIIYGHTHRAEIKEDSGKIIINPGSLSHFMNSKLTYALIKDGKPEIKRL